MKAVVGVDLSGLYESALSIVARLEIPQTEIELVHVDEPSALHPAEEFKISKEGFEVQRTTDSLALDTADAIAKDLKLSVSGKTVVVGGPAKHLIEEAANSKSDLIAIGSHRKSKYGSFFFGSVGRALTIGSPQSILIAKGMVAKTGKLTAVFATDHSTFAEMAIGMLADLKPLGLQKLVVVTALDREMKGSTPKEELSALRKTIKAKGKESVDKLSAAGIPCEYHVVEGEFESVVSRSMKRNNADLLIMGAQGHGFIERMLIGSSSLQQVVTTSHSVLILRPKQV
ncbi:MAG: universal stress protein [Fimbriimonas sp.]|nr:universal stress protein [Fimbriimonas sp.]